MTYNNRSKKDNTMKAIIIAAMTIGFIVTLIFTGVNAWQNYRFVQPLTLADDASTPAQKSEFLGQFLRDVELVGMPEYSNFVFTSERNKMSNQKKVLVSLKARCDDLTKVNPSELGYAQGMQQLTGQEFLHVTNEIRGLYVQAMWVRLGWLACYGWAIMLVLTIATWAWLAVDWS